MLIMVDVVSSEIRSKMMAGIRNKDTQPELILRKGLHALGFRFKLHEAKLKGKPDLTFPKYKAVIFVNGCFWHKHDCYLFKWPTSRKTFWKEKIEGNKKRDDANIKFLKEEGWRILIVWECALKGKKKLPVKEVIQCAASWLRSESDYIEIKGKE